jgi:hypothetical protein
MAHEMTKRVEKYPKVAHTRACYYEGQKEEATLMAYTDTQTKRITDRREDFLIF